MQKDVDIREWPQFQRALDTREWSQPMRKAEFASDAPCVVFPSIVGGYNMPGIMVQKDSYDRDVAQRERGVSVVNADNDSGMHKPGYPGDDVLSVVWVSVGDSGGLFFVSMILSVL